MINVREGEGEEGGRGRGGGEKVGRFYLCYDKNYFFPSGAV